MTQMIELVVLKDMKTVFTTMFIMFKNVEERLTTLSKVCKV